jgi:hypothetical protein
LPQTEEQNVVRAARIAYFVLAWAFLIGLVVQVFLIGLYLFANGALADHEQLGWILHLSPLLVLLAAFLARAGSRHWQWALVLAIVVFLVPILATLKASVPVAAALHPVSAMLAFAVAVVVAVNSWRALQMPEVSSQPG